MNLYAKSANVLALAILAAGCSADAPLPPVAPDLTLNRYPVQGSAETAVAAEQTFHMEVGWTAPFEVGSRQYQRFVRYSSTNPQVAEVTSTGTIRALAQGTSTVTGTLGTNSRTAQVIVTSPAAPPKVSRFSITPKFGAAIDLGATQKFTAAATWDDGVARDVSVTYKASGGTVSSMGLFKAGQTAGVFTVIASCVCGMADTAFLRVGPVPAQLTSLKISPKSVTLQPGAIQQFNSVATWNTGDTTPPPRSYSATGGTITATGAFTAASTPGTYRVIVAHAGGVLRDTAVVTISSVGSNPESPAPPPAGPPPVSGPGWTYHEDFEGGVLGKNISRFFGGTFPRSGTTRTDERAVSGNQSARLSIQSGTDGWGTWGGVLDFPEKVGRGQTIRVRAHFWMPASFVPNQRNGDRLKFMRIDTRKADGSGAGYLDLHYNWQALTARDPLSWSYEGGSSPGEYWRDFGAGHPIQKEKWESFEWAITLDNKSFSAGGMARVLFWKNGKLVLDLKDVRTLTTSNDFASRFLLFTYWNGNAQQDMHIFLDDLTVTTKVPSTRDSNGNPFLGG